MTCSRTLHKLTVAITLLASQAACTLADSTPAAQTAAPAAQTAAPASLFAIYCRSSRLAMEGLIFAPLELALLPAVRNELALTEVQAGKITQLIDTTRTIFSEQYPQNNFQGVTYEKIEREAGEARKRLIDILRPQQAERFKQMIFKHYGLLSIQSRDLRQLLILTPEQEYQVDLVRSDFFAELNRLVAYPLTAEGDQLCQIVKLDNDRARFLADEAGRRIEMQLTPAQRQVIDQMRQ